MDTKVKHGIGRREFLGAAAAALFAGVAIQITGCTTESDSPSAQAGDETGSIAENHGHSAVITKVTLDAGGTVTLDIKGSADHTHSLELTADDVAKIKANTHVMKPSTVTGGHQHTIMFN